MHFCIHFITHKSLYTFVYIVVYMPLEKPKSITIQISDRKEKKFTSFVVYGMTLDEVEKRVKKALDK